MSSEPLNLAELQRQMAAAIMMPLTAGEEMRAHAADGRAMTSVAAGFIAPNLPLMFAAQPLISATARMNSGCRRWLLIGKFSTARWVCGPYKSVCRHANFTHRVAFDAVNIRTLCAHSPGRRIGGRERLRGRRIDVIRAIVECRVSICRLARHYFSFTSVPHS